MFGDSDFNQDISSWNVSMSLTWVVYFQELHLIKT